MQTITKTILAMLGALALAGVPYVAAGAGARAASYQPDHCHITCGTTATRIECDANQKTYAAEVDSGASTTVYIGDSGVTTSTYGASYTASDRFGGDLAYEYCIVSSGSVTLHVRAGVDK